MTERELFRRFYRAARIDLSDEGECLRAEITRTALRTGMNQWEVDKCRGAALCAILDRDQLHREPSKQSVAIQTMVFTFGRVTKGVTA